MANQHAQRNWRQEMANTAARLSMCVFVPGHLTANTRVRCSCLHGVVKETTVVRFVERQFCCKSQASKAHDPEQKRKAAVKSWVTGKEKHLQARRQRWNNPNERVKHSEIMKGVENSWIPTPKQRLLPGTLYLIRYLDESGTHFKLGITRLTLAERFRKGQLISIIHLHNATLGECFDREQSLLKWAKDNGHRYSSPTTTELIHPDGLPYLLNRLTALASIA
jgi:hypothetical protein